MTKPAITNRVTKGAALTYSELDTNFSNLQNATISVTDGTNSHAFNLNDTITFTAGTNITLAVNPTTGAITITGTSTGVINSGLASKLAFYPSAGTTLDDTRIEYSYDSVGKVVSLDANNVDSNDSLDLYASSIHLKPAGGISLTCGTTDSNVGINTNIGFSTSAGKGHIVPSNTATYANNATVDFSNFSGMIMINRQDGSSGNVALWLCGGGTAAKLGDSHGNESGTIAGNSGINGYRWTNNTGGTITVNFFAVQTRGGA